MKSINLLLTTAAIVLAVDGSVRASTLFFDFGNSANPTAGNYNNLTYGIAGTTPGSPVTVSLNNAIDSTGAATTISLSTVISSTTWAGMNTSGTASPSGAASIFPVTATSDFFYASFHAPVISLTGLDGSGNTSYSFTFFGSRAGVADNREANYYVAGFNSGSVLLDAANNTANVGLVSGITPDSSGNLSITVSAGPNNNNSSGFVYFNAMEISISPVPEPSTLALLTFGGLGMILVSRRCRSHAS